MIKIRIRDKKWPFFVQQALEIENKIIRVARVEISNHSLKLNGNLESQRENSDEVFIVKKATSGITV